MEIWKRIHYDFSFFFKSLTQEDDRACHVHEVIKSQVGDLHRKLESYSYACQVLGEVHELSSEVVGYILTICFTSI